MTLDFTDGGGYLIIVDESNLSVYVRLITNDVIGMDDDIQYYGYQSTFFNGQKVSNLVSVGTVGGGIDPGINSAGGENIGLNSAPSASPSDVTPATTYGFALDGRRVGKAGAVEMKYLYDGENVVYELWDDMTVRFVHPLITNSCGGCGCGPGNSIFFTDHPISISIDGVKYYYLYDGLGSVTELIDVGENVVNFYRYTPFGDALVREEAVYNPHQFTGRQYDAESGLYHYRARAYSPGMARFLQQDPIGMVDGANMYAYVGNNPVNGVDPSGTQLTWSICMNLAYTAYRYKLKGWNVLWNFYFISCLWCVYAIYMSERGKCGSGYQSAGCNEAARMRYQSNVIDCQKKSGKVSTSGAVII